MSHQGRVHVGGPECSSLEIFNTRVCGKSRQVYLTGRWCHWFDAAYVVEFTGLIL